ncbi:SPOR domain-containing protein [Nannocystaceae bacterium ST9]
MREMHKWKDKTEFSLDNRQIFFLFFGLSVIGCFVFALGIMTGRRLQWVPGQESAALADDDSLALLDEEPADEPEHFAFKNGLAESDAEAIPPTRDPAIPPRDEDEVKAENAAKAIEQIEQRQAAADAVEQTLEQREPVIAAVAPQAAREPKPTSAASAESPAQASAAERRFTLQMKAFSRREDADKLAAKLQHDGHDVRIESHDVRGRTWHRVRLGEFDTWDEALAAKQEFEKSEKVIAYVVSL